MFPKHVCLQRTRSGFGEQYNVLRKFVHAQAGDMSILDAAVNEVQPLDCLDKQKRHLMYNQLAQACGWVRSVVAFYV
jgi:hypothetical protein